MNKMIAFISCFWCFTLTFAWCGTNDIIKDTAFGMMLGTVVGTIVFLVMMYIEEKKKEKR